MKELSYIDLKYKPTKKDLIAKYRLEPDGVSFEEACEQLAAESSIGTWTDICTMSPKIAKKLKPHVFSINKRKNLAEIAYPEALFEAGNMPQILSSIAGNIFGMKIVKNLRFVDVSFSEKLGKSFQGPAFGVSGIRKLLKVKKRPLVGTIIKPKVGLNEKEHAEVAYDAWVGGLDIVKDDENLTDMSFNRFEKRVVETLKLRDKAEKETGEKKIYMPNVTAETDEMLRRARFVKKCGGEYVMVDILTLGFSALQTLRKANLGLVLHAHRAMHAALTRNEHHGISMLVLAKITRLIGADQLHIGTAFVGKMSGSAKEVIDIESAISEKSFGIKPVFAVASGGLHPGHVPKLAKRMGTDIIMQFGGGVHGHPDGTRAGAAAVRHAAEAVTKEVSLKQYAKTHKELAGAIEKWGC